VKLDNGVEDFRDLMKGRLAFLSGKLGDFKITDNAKVASY